MLPIGEPFARDLLDELVEIFFRVQMEDVREEQDELGAETRVEIDGPEVAVVGGESELRIAGGERAAIAPAMRT